LPQGEVGILTRVETAVENAIAPHCVLVIHYNDQDYLGTLSFDDEEFLETVCEVLKSHTGRSISTIGSLYVS
jgi:type IV secretory pathway ATPase VirB11/archaellum biosynthesis ATPase